MNYKMITNNIHILELLRNSVEDIRMNSSTHEHQSMDFLEHQSHIIYQIALEAEKLKKEMIQYQIKAQIPNKDIANYFKVTPARVSQIKANMPREFESDNSYGKYIPLP